MPSKLADKLVAADLATANGNTLIAEALGGAAEVFSAKSVLAAQKDRKGTMIYY